MLALPPGNRTIQLSSVSESFNVNEWMNIVKEQGMTFDNPETNPIKTTKWTSTLGVMSDTFYKVREYAKAKSMGLHPDFNFMNPRRKGIRFAAMNKLYDGVLTSDNFHMAIDPFTKKEDTLKEIDLELNQHTKAMIDLGNYYHEQIDKIMRASWKPTLEEEEKTIYPVPDKTITGIENEWFTSNDEDWINIPRQDVKERLGFFYPSYPVSVNKEEEE